MDLSTTKGLIRVAPLRAHLAQTSVLITLKNMMHKMRTFRFRSPWARLIGRGSSYSQSLIVPPDEPVTRAVVLLRFSRQLRIAMQAAGLGRSPTKLSHQFNLRYHGQPVTVSAANNWIWGVSLPHIDKLIVLSEMLNTSLDTFLK